MQPRLATKWAARRRSPTSGRSRSARACSGRTAHRSPSTTSSPPSIASPIPRSALPRCRRSRACSRTATSRRWTTQTVKFHLDRPYGDFPTLVSSFNYNSVILPKDYKEGTFTKGGIGTGPFILKTFSADQGASYVKNPKYWAAPRCPTWTPSRSSTSPDTPPIVLAIQGGLHRRVPAGVPTRARRRCSRMPNIHVSETPSSEYRTLQMRVDQDPWNEGGAPGAGVLARPARPRRRACSAARPSSATTTRSRPSTRARQPPRRCRSGRRTSPRPSSCCRPPG